ncbi:hypothetical protein SAMN06297387_12262 [Streptomyces zhaozhouensis]|uniref:Antibiotic biosynthesis monooxygenase n=1 Tax=Streptomyces zhaozhouensis TaxID=1300267 RepID=A0A286E3W7_9ACTN|nr:hypothetical protein [Streptomyces zhaozhouensis]SOD65583.1 hypothetical protein SAMN06297387_12262 [Streptomyces zhaozhouensis]
MPQNSVSLPVIDRPDVHAASVEVIVAEGRETQQSVLDAVAADWRSRSWPRGLVSASSYRSTDERSVLTYVQWATREAVDRSLREDRNEPGWGVAGASSRGPVPYRLYRVVRGGALTEPAPVPGCFPAAVFPMTGVEAARRWIDGLLAAEEETEGEDRAYPGAIAANFHVSLDGSSVLVLSEWASEKEAADHIDEVIEPLLEAAGGGDAGARYVHCLTLSGPDV